MSKDRDLIDTIKTHFARKSSAQLHEILQVNDEERWSGEAIVAAREVLQDRMAGRAPEPEVAEDEPTPPPDHSDFEHLALGVLGSLVSSLLIGHLHLHIPMPHDRVDYAGNPAPPVSFGPKMAWLALDTTDTGAVATALGMRERRDASWAEGIKAAQSQLLRATPVFVTPPLGDWTLAMGTALFPPDRTDTFVKLLVERLSGQFGDVQYFCTNRDVELQVWARARKGRLVRGYGCLGETGRTLWDEGAPTKEERDLGFQFCDGQCPMVEQGHNKDITHQDESCVMQLACLWSFDPTSLDEEFKEPVMGLLGNVAWEKEKLSGTDRYFAS